MWSTDNRRELQHVSVRLCLQHDRRDATRRAALFVAGEICNTRKPSFEVATTNLALATFMSRNSKLWPINLTCELDVHNVKINQRAKLLAQRSFGRQQVIVRAQTNKHTPDQLLYPDCYSGRR